MLGAVHHKINDFTCCRQNFGYEFFQYNVGSSEPGSSGIFVEGLANGEETSKGDQLGIPNIISNIGNVYYKMGDYRSATKQFQEAVDLYNKLIDKHKRTLQLRLEILSEHVSTTNSFHRLGVVYCTMGDFTSALEAFQRAWDMRSNLLGDHPDMARSYQCVGLVQMYTGDLQGAVESLQKALKLKKCLQDFPGMADIFNDLGCVYLESGDYQFAREQFQDALDLNKEFRGKHVNTANCCHNLIST